MRGRGRRFLSLLVAVLVTTIYLAPLVAQAQSCAGVTTMGEWKVVSPKPPTAGPPKITAHAVDPTNNQVIYVTNGTVVAVSTNGGCNFKETYPAAGAGTLPTTIKAIDTPAGGVAVLLLQRGTDAAGSPSVAFTVDAGKTWTEGGVGLPPIGTAEFLESPGDVQEILYMGVDEGAGAADLLYVSNDNGQTWTLLNDLTKTKPSMQIYGLTADPIVPNLMWAYGPGGMWVTEDGGASFEAINAFAGENVIAADANRESGNNGRILALIAGKNQARMSTDSGKTWPIQAVPSGADSVDHLGDDWSFVITANGRTYLYDYSTRGWLDLDAPVSGGDAVQGVRGVYPAALAVHTDTEIEVWQGGYDPSITEDRYGGQDFSLSVPLPQLVKDAKFGPSGRKIVLKAGQQKTIPYNLTVPPTRVPLDVYLLVDTSSSMKNTIDALAARLAEIVNALIAEDVDVRFGLAMYRSYPQNFPPRQECDAGDVETPSTPCERNYIYEQYVDITTDTGILEEGLEGLAAEAGGLYDAHLAALKVTATGEAMDLPPLGVTQGYDVEPGEQADFREKSLKVVINASDEAFGRSDSNGNTDPGSNFPKGPPPDIPSMDEVAAAFNQEGNEIEHVGLSVGRLPYNDMKTLSRKTETFATNNVDCDLDGDVDVPAGEPLVCKLYQEDLEGETPNVAPAVVGLLKAVQNRASVGMEVQKGEEVVKDMTPASYADVALQTSHQLPFSVTYSCAKSQMGKRFPVKLAPNSPQVPMSSLSVDALVVCKDEPEKKPPFLPAYLTIPLVGLVIPPPPPPPPPAPVSNTQPATQSQAQGQAQAAAATQEEEQPQLAYVTAYEEAEALENQFAMSAYTSRRRGLPPGAALGLGAVSVSMMYGAGYALRRRTRVERAYR